MHPYQSPAWSQRCPSWFVLYQAIETTTDQWSDRMLVSWCRRMLCNVNSWSVTQNAIVITNCGGHIHDLPSGIIFWSPRVLSSKCHSPPAGPKLEACKYPLGEIQFFRGALDFCWGATAQSFSNDSCLAVPTVLCFADFVQCPLSLQAHHLLQ